MSEPEISPSQSPKIIKDNIQIEQGQSPDLHKQQKLDPMQVIQISNNNSSSCSNSNTDNIIDEENQQTTNSKNNINNQTDNDNINENDANQNENGKINQENSFHDDLNFSQDDIGNFIQFGKDLDNITLDLNNIDDVRQQFKQHYEMIYQQPEGQNLLEQLQNNLDQLSDELNSISHISSDNQNNNQINQQQQQQQSFQNDEFPKLNNDTINNLSLNTLNNSLQQQPSQQQLQQSYSIKVHDISNLSLQDNSLQFQNVQIGQQLDNSYLNKLENELNDLSIQNSTNSNIYNQKSFQDSKNSSFYHRSRNNSYQQLNKSASLSKSTQLATNQSAKPSKYIPQAIKQKLDVLVLNLHKELKVLSHSKLILIWVANRIHMQSHQKFWKELQESYRDHIIMKRFASSAQFEEELQTGNYQLNPIILMVSGYCGHKSVPKVYNKYRFKGIIVYTDKVGMGMNKDWVKRFPRVVLLTDNQKKAQDMLHNLIHNTLFRGACKFKDLDHFLGRKFSVKDYCLLDDIQQQLQIPETNNAINDKNQQDQEKKTIQKNNYKGKKDNKQSTPKHQSKLKKSYKSNLLYIENEKQEQEFMQKEKEQQEQYNQKNKGNQPFVYKSFKDVTVSKQINLDKLLHCKDVINRRKVLIRTDMLQKNVLEKMAELFEQCFPQEFQNNISQTQITLQNDQKSNTQQQNQQQIQNPQEKQEQQTQTINGKQVYIAYPQPKPKNQAQKQENKQIKTKIQDIQQQNSLELDSLSSLDIEEEKKQQETEQKQQQNQQNSNNNLQDNNVSDKEEDILKQQENQLQQLLSIEKDEQEYQIAVNLLKFYTKKETDFYALINCALNTLNEDLITQLQTMIKSVRLAHTLYDDSQDTQFEVGQVINLWRGCTFDREYFHGFFRKGEHIIFPAFTSTTIDLDEAKKFAMAGNERRIIFQIQCVCDEKFMKNRPKNLKSISAYPEESEYLMNCFSLLYIEDIDTDWQGGYLLYKLKLLR